ETTGSLRRQGFTKTEVPRSLSATGLRAGSNSFSAHSEPPTRPYAGRINIATGVYQNSYALPFCFSSGLIPISKIPPSLQYLLQTLCNWRRWHLACPISATNSFGFRVNPTHHPDICTSEARSTPNEEFSIKRYSDLCEPRLSSVKSGLPAKLLDNSLAGVK